MSLPFSSLFSPLTAWQTQAIAMQERMPVAAPVYARQKPHIPAGDIRSLRRILSDVCLLTLHTYGAVRISDDSLRAALRRCREWYISLDAHAAITTEGVEVAEETGSELSSLRGSEDDDATSKT